MATIRTGPESEALQQLHDLIQGHSSQSLSALLEKLNESFLKMTDTEGEGELIAYTFEHKALHESYEIRIHRDDAFKFFFTLMELHSFMTIERKRTEQQYQKSIRHLLEERETLKQQRNFYRYQAREANNELHQVEKTIKQLQQKARTCEICGKSLEGKRADALTCSARCRNEKRRRKNEKK